MRAGEWWEFKLAPIFAAFYGTAFLCGVPVAALWRGALVLLLSIAPGAMFVSVINDVTDREEDRAAGKHNRLANRSPLLIALLLAITIGCGLAFAFLWRRDPPLLSCYLAAWAAFTLYSARPFRFKARGILGVLCDASGAHLFPTLVGVLLAYRNAAHAVSAMWIGAVAVWAFACGLRGILWHQLFDAENDRRSGIATFAQTSTARVALLGTWIVFPIELAALTLLLVQLRSFWPLALLGVYLIEVAGRVRFDRRSIAVVTPRERAITFLQEYYTFYLPAAILVASALRDSRDWIVLAIHLLAFPAGVLRWMSYARRLVLRQNR